MTRFAGVDPTDVLGISVVMAPGVRRIGCALVSVLRSLRTEMPASVVRDPPARAERLPDFLHGERQAVHRYRRRKRGRAGDGFHSAGAGNPERRPCTRRVGVPTALIGKITVNLRAP